MKDSERAAELSREFKVEVGLHLNFDERFTASCARHLTDYHAQTSNYLTKHRYSQAIYNPALRQAFSYSYMAQMDEFRRLFGKWPSHVDGHHHMHLCANIAFSNLIPPGIRMRRNFSFWPGEKGMLNRGYRRLIDRWLERKYQLTVFFFDLLECIRDDRIADVEEIAKSRTVELMTHPIVNVERRYLLSDQFELALPEFIRSVEESARILPR